MTIKEVCEKYAITQDTLRYYEKAGVIPKVHRSCGGTRCYGEEDLKAIEYAVCLRKAGMSVAAIAEYVRLAAQGNETLAARLALLRREREQVLQQKLMYDEALLLMDYKIGKYEEAIRTGELNWDTPCEKAGKA